MTTLREAAQQALEALDAFSWEQVDAARTALRAALAQPAPEPVAWRNPATDDVVSAGRRKEWESGRYGLAAQGSTARFTQPLFDCRAALAQPAPDALREALELIAAPQRPDGTWNRDREACRRLAVDALAAAPIIVPEITADKTQPAPEPVATPEWWRTGLAVTLMREGINKHRAREIADGYWQAYCQIDDVADALRRWHTRR